MPQLETLVLDMYLGRENPTNSEEGVINYLHQFMIDLDENLVSIREVILNTTVI